MTTNDTSSRPRVRLFAAVQSAGRIGKSTASLGLAHWAAWAGIPWAAVDADLEHHAFSDVYPATPLLDVTGDPGTLRQAVDEVCRGEVPLYILDVPAQATSHLLAGLSQLRLLDVLDEAGIRLTVPLFPADDPTAQNSLAVALEALEGRVDWLVVKNSGRFTTKDYDRGSLRVRLEGQPNVRHLAIPALTKATTDDLQAANAAAERYLTWAEAVPKLSTGSRFELEGWLNNLLRQFEDAADILLPDPALIQRRVTRLGDAGPKVSRVNKFNPFA